MPPAAALPATAPAAPPLWAAARVASVTAYLALVVLVVVRPQLGLPLLWDVVVPVLPATFALAPGLWRNVCPMAATNQLPRALGRTRGRPLPVAVRRHGALGALVLFVLVVAARKAGLDEQPGLVAALLVALLAGALAGGVAFAGKSGWCGTVCPLRVTQAVYGLAPAVAVPHAHCKPCVGCSANCPDLKPGTAHRDDVLAREGHRARPVLLLAGLLPGLIVAFHASPATGPAGLLHLALAAALSLAVLGAVLRLTAWPRDRVVMGLAGLSLALFYAFTLPTALGPVAGVAVGGGWLRRAWKRQAPAAAGAAPAGLVVTPGYVGPERRSVARGLRMASVTLAGSGTAQVRPGATLADALRELGAPAPSGCGAGACGADPIHVVAGADALSPPEPVEAATLERLALPPGARLACSARVQGDVTVALSPGEASPAPRPRPAVARRRTGRRVVVLGAGVAGLTVAEEVRRADPDARIRLVGSERDPAYNRTALLDVAARGTAIERLHLRDAAWYAEHGVEHLAERFAVRIDRDARAVLLADGERLDYDALVLATGSRSRLPTLPGFGRPGSFLLRTADDARALGEHLDRLPGARAVVCGGGPLGVETAAALAARGVAVALVASGPLLPRHLDARGARLLAEHLRSLGVDVRTGVRARAVTGDERVEAVVLEDGEALPADLVVACAGVVPNAELAREAGLAVARGVVVDDELRTDDDAIWAVGDVAEHDGRVDGLWATAVQQAVVAAAVITGGEAGYSPDPPAVAVDLPGGRLSVIGERSADAQGAILLPTAGRHCRLDVVDGHLTGAVLWAAPTAEPTLRRAIERRLPVGALRDALAQGDLGTMEFAIAAHDRAAARRAHALRRAA